MGYIVTGKFDNLNEYQIEQLNKVGLNVLPEDESNMRKVVGTSYTPPKGFFSNSGSNNVQTVQQSGAGNLIIMNKDNEAEFLQKKLTTDITIGGTVITPYSIAFGGWHIFQNLGGYIVDNTGTVLPPAAVNVTIQELSNQSYGNALVPSNNNLTLARLARLLSAAPLVIRGIKLSVNGTGTLPGTISFTYIEDVENGRILEVPSGKVSKSTISPDQYNTNIVYYNLPELIVLDGTSVLVMNMPANIPTTLTFKVEFALGTIARPVEGQELASIQQQYKLLNKICY